MAVAESGMDELRTLVTKAVGRAELKARKRENLKGQAIELMERIAADVLTHQVRAS